MKSPIGRPPESLTIGEAIALAGHYMALPIYSPDTIPLRIIEAVGETPEDCIRELAARGRDPRQFEYVRVKLPF